MQRVNLADPPFVYDDEEPPAFRAGMYRYGKELGAVKTGTSLYELPRGTSICPYHYEGGEEEWLLVLSGTPTLRTPEGETVLSPLDSIFFPVGPEGAHAVRNDADEVARVLMYSQVEPVSVCVYPDSDKVGVWVEGQPEANGEFPRDAAVDYFEGEG